HPPHPPAPVRRNGRRRHRRARRPHVPSRPRSWTHRGRPLMTLLAEKPKAPAAVQPGLMQPGQLWQSLPDAVRKLDPRTMWRNPVMFIVEVGAVFTTVLSIVAPSVLAWTITVWLWLTVVFANLAEAVAEGRGK